MSLPGMRLPYGGDEQHLTDATLSSSLKGDILRKVDATLLDDRVSAVEKEALQKVRETLATLPVVGLRARGTSNAQAYIEATKKRLGELDLLQSRTPAQNKEHTRLTAQLKGLEILVHGYRPPRPPRPPVYSPDSQSSASSSSATSPISPPAKQVTRLKKSSPQAARANRVSQTEIPGSRPSSQDRSSTSSSGVSDTDSDTSPARGVSQEFKSLLATKFVSAPSPSSPIPARVVSRQPPPSDKKVEDTAKSTIVPPEEKPKAKTAPGVLVTAPIRKGTETEIKRVRKGTEAKEQIVAEIHKLYRENKDNVNSDDIMRLVSGLVKSTPLMELLTICRRKLDNGFLDFVDMVGNIHPELAGEVEIWRANEVKALLANAPNIERVRQLIPEVRINLRKSLSALEEETKILVNKYQTKELQAELVKIQGAKALVEQVSIEHANSHLLAVIRGDPKAAIGEKLSVAKLRELLILGFRSILSTNDFAKLLTQALKEKNNLDAILFCKEWCARNVGTDGYSVIKDAIIKALPKDTAEAFEASLEQAAKPQLSSEVLRSQNSDFRAQLMQIANGQLSSREYKSAVSGAANDLQAIVASCYLLFTPDSLFKPKWDVSDKDKSSSQEKIYSETLNRISDFVRDSFFQTTPGGELAFKEPKKREELLRFYIDVAVKALKDGAFPVAIAINAALQSVPIERMKYAWAGISKKQMEAYSEVRELLPNNAKEYRKRLQERGAETSVPHQSKLAGDLTFIHDGNPKLSANHETFNFDGKLQKSNELISEFLAGQEHARTLLNMPLSSNLNVALQQFKPRAESELDAIINSWRDPKVGLEKPRE